MQTITLNQIDKDLIRHFNEIVNRLQPEIVEGVMEFFGFFQTSKSLLKVKYFELLVNLSIEMFLIFN